MSIASELNWTTASKPKFGKATEHSGAKKGKGAWDKKKVAKKGSNKGRRAGGKQEIKDQTVGDESDGPFPGAAPLFTKAASMNWGIDLRGVSTPALELANSLLDQAIARQAIAEPRPCYPSEEPVKDHCNDGISPPAPGGGDGGDFNTLDDFGDPIPDTGFSPQGEPLDDNPIWDEDKREEEEEFRRQEQEEDQYDADSQQRYQQELDDEERQMEKEEREELYPLGRELMEEDPEDGYGEDPMADPAPQAPGPLQGDPHGPRDPSLGPDAPHQFWSQEQPHIQDALNKYLVPQLQSTKPGVADKARKILMEGPHS